MEQGAEVATEVAGEAGAVVEVKEDDYFLLWIFFSFAEQLCSCKGVCLWLGYS